MASAREHEALALEDLKKLKGRIYTSKANFDQKSKMLISANDVMSNYVQALKKLRRALGMSHKKLEECMSVKLGRRPIVKNHLGGHFE